MRRLLILMLLLSMTIYCGCSSDVAGSQSAAKSYFDSELLKWFEGNYSEVSKIVGIRRSSLISYDIQSMSQDSPDPLALYEAKDLPENWKEWPAYKVNVAFEYISLDSTPKQTVYTYHLTWNSHERKWYVARRY